FTLLVLSLVCTCGRAQKSEGQDFWFTFLQHRDPGNNKVALISARQATSGVISVPGSGWSQNFTVAANGIANITLPPGAETLGSETVRSTAVHVTANAVVSVYMHQYFGFRSEASLVLPTPALGTDYMVLAYTGRPDNSVNYPSTLAVVGTEDDTEVVISDIRARTEGGRAIGSTITVTLDQGEVYQIRAIDANSDLTGTRINSSLPVSVYAGASWSGVPANSCGVYDNLLEANFPVSQWGLTYLGVPTLNNAENLYRILAAEDGTTVSVDDGNGISNRQLNAGGYYDFSTGRAISITADKPILVGEFLLGSNCNGHPNPTYGDPSYFLLNELTQTLDTVTVFNSTLQDIRENYLNIVFRAGDEVGIELDGAPLGVPIETAPGGEYAYARVQVGAGSHTVTSAGCGVIVTVYGYGDRESYAYSGGAAFRNINANPIVEGGCLNDTIQFATGLDTLRFKHEWTLEDGSIERRADFPRFYDQLGEYPIRLVIHDECLDRRDTSFRDISITLRQAVTVSPDTRLCAGEEVTFEASDVPGASYRWEGPNGFLEETQTISWAAVNPDLAGVYSAVGIVSGCETFPASTELTVDTLPVVRIRGDSAFCPRIPEEFASLNAGDYLGYQWSNGQAGNPLTIRIPGVYTVTVTDDQGCRGTAEATVAAFCPVRFYIPTAFSPNSDGINDRFAVNAVDAEAVRLQIFDRWGQQVFLSSEGIPDWDGNVAGRPAASGTYGYVVEVEGFDEGGRYRTFQKAGAVVLVR
ncbi:MAG: gliding motility-associated C-terminal domain-containing protein, partial [Bacteroidota bacterium]